MQNKTEAFDWWMDYYENNEEIHGYMMTGIPQFLNPYAKRKSLVARISFLGFNVGDGELLTISEV